MKILLRLTLLTGLLFAVSPNPEVPFTGHGDAQALSAVYTRWKDAYESQDNPNILRIALNYSKGLSQELTDARGFAALDLLDGRLKVAVAGLPAQDHYDVWLLDNHYLMGKSEIRAIRVGALQSKGDKQTLLVTLERQQLAAFTLDAIAVTKAGATVQKGGLLFGSPGLLQRLYYNNRFSSVASISLSTEEKLAKTSAFEFLLPKPAQAANSLVGADLNALIARGQQLFTEETFAGNGRTCATCHRPDNNHTIDPQYIAKLPRKDPLFVAEYNPELANLEKPALLRQFGLFVANVDGFDKPAVMRSAQHLLGLANSLTFETSAMGGEFVEDDSYFNDHDIIAQATSQHTQAIGWSGDGAPDGGSLRDFAKGAIKQHLPKTLNRVENSDFRMPTEDELDALEAYMLSLGRTTDINLATMTFKSPLVQRGLQLFNTKNNPGEAVANGAVTGTPVFGTSANCNGCHMNAGAISSTTGGNPTRDTGVERMRDQLHRLVDSSVAFDGGFGQVQQQDCGPNFDQTCYSDGSVDPRGVRPADHPRLNRFNTPSLVEAADTGPFFHNNSVTTLEETVAFYNTEAFNNSPGAFTSKGINRQVKLDSSQVIAVALFLRTINVLENIRSSSQLDQEAINQTGNAYDRTVHLAEEDTKDAVDVFTDAVVNPYPAATTKLKMALQYEQKAKSGFTLSAQRISYLQKAIALKAEARNMIVSGG